jgi:hypothetical protein
MPTPILVVGRNAVDVLAPYLDRLLYGPETVTFARTVGDARGRLGTLPPPAVLFLEVEGAPAGFVCEVCRLNSDVKVIALGEKPETFRCDAVLPIPLGFETFCETLEKATMAYAAATGGFRGLMEDGGGPKCCGGCD